MKSNTSILNKISTSKRKYKENKARDRENDSQDPQIFIAIRNSFHSPIIFMSFGKACFHLLHYDTTCIHYKLTSLLSQALSTS